MGCSVEFVRHKVEIGPHNILHVTTLKKSQNCPFTERLKALFPVCNIISCLVPNVYHMPRASPP